jgi:quercetin dioxygenase-like cupin family protein
MGLHMIGDTQMIYRESKNQKWIATPYEGVRMCGLRQNELGGGAVLLKITKGARFPTHDHPGGEEVYVIQGRAVIGDVIVKDGDYLWTPPHASHDLKAEEETLLFVSSPKGIKVLE